MQHLQQRLPDCSFVNIESIGINPDAKEAILFAILANETVCGDISSEKAFMGIPQVSMGKISFPL
jgi:anhydro-N-acetylmuramic acid kinase